VKPIIGVILAKNEDLHIAHVINGVKDFVDDIIMIDNCSRDETVSEAKRCGVSPVIEEDLRNTHSYVEGFVGQDVWVFGVDGDEIFDRDGLATLHKQLKNGLYSEAYQIQGWYLHATEIDFKRNRAKGYLGPPSHTPTKLYNMSRITAWPNTHDDVLFHVGTRVVNGVKMRVEPDTWEGNPLRCVHMRFFQRSSKESRETIGVRLGPDHTIGRRLKTGILGSDHSKNLRCNYRRGSIREVDIWSVK
jgi:glycosyltransferase involved in cell wall biosynthesis